MWSDLVEVHPLRRLRYDRMIRLVELERLTGVHVSALSRIERWLVQPTRDQEVRISRALGVAITSLFPAKTEASASRFLK
jgi:transcriptional regulator with XRE-family HTH domain